MRIKPFIALLALVLTFLHPRDAIGQNGPTVTWAGPDGGAWSNPNNWSPVGVPGANTQISIATTTPISIVLDYDYGTTYANYPWSFNASGPVTFSGTGDVSTQWTMSFSGANILSGNFYGFENIAFSNCIIDGGKMGTNIIGGVFFNNSDFNAGSINGGENDNGAIDGTVNFNGGTMVTGDDAAMTVDSQAVWNINDPALLGGQLYDAGTVNNHAGELIQGGLTVSGTIALPAVYNVFSTAGLDVENYLDEWSNLQISGNATFNQYGNVYVAPSEYPNPALSSHCLVIGTSDGSSLYHIFGGSLSVPGLDIGANGIVLESYISGPGTFEQDGGGTSTTLATILAGSNMYLNAGRFSGSISNAGILKIDSSVTLFIPQLAEFTGSELQLTDLLPTSAAMIATTQTSALAGELSIQLAADYTPAMGDVLDLISSPGITGEFDSYDLPTLQNRLYWQPEFTPTNFSLVVLPEPETQALAMMIFAGTVIRRRK